MGAPRIISLHTILGPPDHFLRLLYAPPPQISFFICYRGATSHLGLFHKIYGGPLRSVSPLTIWGPLRSVSVHTFWGPHSDRFFLLLYGAPLRSVFSLTIIWGPLRSVSSLTIWGAPQISFFAYYMGVP